MASGNINYNAVLADLEARKTELESAIETIKGILAAGGGSLGGSSDGGIDPENIPTGAFLRLSIADATKKFLDMVKIKQSVPQILKALERGGLPPVKYTTLYTVLRRRESQIGDVLRLGDEWALTEWYPNNPNLRKKSAAKATGKGKKGKGKGKAATKAKAKPSVAKKPAAVTPTPSSESPVIREMVVNVKTPDAAELVLTQVGHGLDLATLTAQVNGGYGKKLNANFLKGNIANDSKKRFIDLGNDVWDLASRHSK